MALIRFSPLEEMSVLRDQINRIFEPISTNGDSRSLSHTLPVEVTETPEKYCVRLMVPGLPPEKIDLQATQQELIVSCETQPRELQENEVVHLNQFNYGKFSKKLNFPEAINHEAIEAKYEYGILEVSLPKVESAQRKQIEIKVMN